MSRPTEQAACGPRNRGGGKVRRVLKAIIYFVLTLILLFILFIGICALLNLRTPCETDLSKSMQLATPPAPLTGPVTLKIVTFNVWGLYALSDHRLERMVAIGEVLAGLAPDVIGLQEAFIESDRDIILTALRKAGIEHHVYFRSGLFGSGLLVASRFPIESLQHPLSVYDDLLETA